MNNPCAEIPLSDYMDGDFEVCQLAVVMDDMFNKLDNIANAPFTENNGAWKTKRKNKKLWRSIGEDWTPTKLELT